MVSRETQICLSREFVAGIISISATFIHINSSRIEQFGFQIKLSKENFEILNSIRTNLGIETPVRTFKENKVGYALLITRSRKTLLTKIIPFMDEYLFGPKLVSYLQWKKDLLKFVQ